MKSRLNEAAFFTTYFGRLVSQALTGGDAKQILKLYEAIDDNDDVQKVYANFDIDENEME